MSDLMGHLMALNDTARVRGNDVIRAPFGYPGAKNRSIHDLLQHLPYRKTFIDVCGGTGSVLFARQPSKLEVFNDRCAGITALYRCIRDAKLNKALLERLTLVPSCSREEFAWCHETWQQDHHDDVERAARWYYSVVHSFNQKGWSFGRAVKAPAQCGKYWNNLELFWPIHSRIQRVQIENQDWRLILRDYKKDGREVVWYIDPPYWGTKGIYNHEWPNDWHNELCHRIQDLDGGFVALSGYDHPKHPYNTFTIWKEKVTWDVPISMTGLAFQDTNHLGGLEDQIKRGVATETLWIYDPS